MLQIMVVVEDEMELVSPDFMTSFCECLRFYSLLFDSLEENFPRTSNERLMLERISARNLVNTIACDPPENLERQEKGVHWDYRFRRLSFLPCPFSDDVVDDVRALLKRSTCPSLNSHLLKNCRSKYTYTNLSYCTTPAQRS